MSDYWQDRAEQRLLSAEEKALRLEKKLKSRFDQVYRNLEAEIAKAFYEFADENALDYGLATQKLTRAQKKQFRKDMEYYIENTKDEEFQKKLSALYKRARVTKLEAKKAGIEAEVHSLYAEYLNTELQLTLLDVLQEGYYNTIFDMQQFIGVGVSFTSLSPRLLNTLLEYPWSGKNYSEKIWGHVRDFSGKLENVLTVGIIQGKSNQKMASELAKAAEVEYKRAIALVRTETNFIANEATSMAYAEMGVGRYRYLATLDLRTSEQCREKDGKVFNLADKKVGENYPPLHTHCRSTTVPEIEDLEGMRIARKADGSTYKVDRNMKYQDWHDEHVATDPVEAAGEKKIWNKYSDQKQYGRYQERLGKDAPESLKAFREMKYSADSEEYGQLKGKYRSSGRVLRLSSGKVGDTDGYSIVAAVGRLDYNDRQAVEIALADFAGKYHGADIEHALVIASNGSTYMIDGMTSTVGIQLAGEKALTGAIVIHNHPGYFGDSFSKQDFSGYFRYEISELQVLSNFGRYKMLYKGTPLAMKRAEELYEAGLEHVWQKALQNEKIVEYEQHEIMLWLKEQLPDMRYEKVGK